jgi:Uma2 family endonuclease
MTYAYKKYYTEEEYLALEEKAEHKSEYINGQIYLMAGATDTHNQLSNNLGASLDEVLVETPCRVYSGDMKVKTGPKGIITYPDVSIVCDEPEFYDNKRMVLANPVLLVEVLSTSTREYDRTSKFSYYRQIPTLRTYLLVEQTGVQVDCYQKQDENTWVLTTYKNSDDVIKIKVPEIGLSVARLYRKVVFPPPPPIPAKKKRQKSENTK